MTFFLKSIAERSKGKPTGDCLNKDATPESASKVLAAITSQLDMIRNNGASVLELDMDPCVLVVGHIDEIYSVLRTSKKPPCNSVVLEASPVMGMDLLNDEFSQPRDFDKCNDLQTQFLNIGNVDDGNKARAALAKLLAANHCGGAQNPWRLKSFFENHEEALKENKKLQGWIDQNEPRIIEEIKSTTHCTPKVVKVPVAFWGGNSIFSNGVNGVVLSRTAQDASNYIAPKSFYEPFDAALTKRLSEVGITTDFLDVSSYNRVSGNLHCLTNTAPICTRTSPRKKGRR